MNDREEQMSLIGKRILFVGKETFMYPFYYLCDKWGKDNHLAAFWINPHESEFAECDLNRSTFYAFQRKGIKAYTLKNAVEKYRSSQYQNISYKEIHELEGKYSHFKNFNQQILSDQMMSVCYHTRDFSDPPTYDQQLLWLKLIYEDVEYMLNDYRPDVIFDCDIAELPRTVLNEVAYYRNIPYISIAYPKYKMYKIPSYTLNLGIEEYIYKEYQNALQSNNIEEEQYIRDFRLQSSIKNESYLIEGNPTYVYKVEPFIDTVKSIYGRWMYFVQQDKNGNKALKDATPSILVNSKKYIRFWIKSRLFRRWLYKTKNFFDQPSLGEEYVYMPLHLIPESTTFSLAPFWINELTTIEAVSKALPAGWRLYVKEHQSMLGERSKEFYEKVKRIPNVKLVKFNYYDDPKPWIMNCRAVITITGTAAYEAALLGKPAFVFGDVPFALIKGVTKVREVESLPLLLREIQSVSDFDNIKECAAYIRAVKNVGESIDLGTIMNKAYGNLMRGTELDNDFWIEIEKLKTFFENSYKYADDRMKKKVVRV